MLKPQTVQLVQVTDLFFGKSLAWNAFFEGEYDFSWGDNNRSLITKERLVSAIDKTIDSQDEDETIAELEAVKAEAETLPADVYVDMEN